jgi:hypothetical protein
MNELRLKPRPPLCVDRWSSDSLAVSILCDAADRAATWMHHYRILSEIYRIRKLEEK